MFTGIIQATGKVINLQRKGDDASISINTGKLDLSDTKAGDSIAVNGVCLTAVSVSQHGFEADISAESLSRTALGQLTGDSLSLIHISEPTRLGMLSRMPSAA